MPTLRATRFLNDLQKVSPYDAAALLWHYPEVVLWCRSFGILDLQAQIKGRPVAHLPPALLIAWLYSAVDLGGDHYEELALQIAAALMGRFTLKTVEVLVSPLLIPSLRKCPRCGADCTMSPEGSRVECRDPLCGYRSAWGADLKQAIALHNEGKVR